MVCRPCYEGNHDGWSPLFEATLERHLKDLGLPMGGRNAAGFYPRD
jgi:hypothetical protein